MSDFDENWQITGSSDPATPDIQPNQYQPQPQAPVYQQPSAQPQTVPVQQVPVQQAPVQPVQPQYSVPVQQTPFQQAPVQPQYQQPVMTQPQMQPQYQQPVYQGMPQQMQQGYVYQIQQPVMDPAFAQQRENSLIEIEKMLNYFSPKVDVFQNYENINNEILRYSKTSVAPLVWGIIVAAMGLLQLANAIFWVKFSDNKIPYYIIAGVLFLAAAGLIVMYVLKKKNHNAKLEGLIEEAGKLSEELQLLYNCYGECLVRSEYTDPRILFKIKSILLAGRCATIPDSLNSLLMYQHNFQKIETAKAQAAKITSERYEGQPAFFNAVKYFNFM